MRHPIVRRIWLLVVISFPALSHGQTSEELRPPEFPQLLTPIFPTECAQFEALLIEAAKSRAEEIISKTKVYKIILATDRRLWVHAVSVRHLESHNTDSGVVQFLGRDGAVTAEFYTSKIMGWQLIYDEEFERDVEEALYNARERARAAEE